MAEQKRMIRDEMYNNLSVPAEGGAPQGDFATKDELNLVKTDLGKTVKKVNNTAPDGNGNVTIAIPSVAGMVKSVNSVTPNGSGDVTIAIPSVAGMVKKVNNIAPDGAGNVTLPLFTSGTTAQRPASGTVVGQYFFDTDLNKPLYRNKTNNGWVDGAGTVVT
ncbi:hypothetical protein Blue_222 [Bacillus phage Deep Blue]|uniref:Tail fiber protein n=1 Tax=Bacillus phage Deep Blue TaxID=1792245 RepID=A0A140HM32_9CAUD|nr:hypothetical protein Blue_222 [Bacillus phage Deep Blue]AMO26044.1 hypothetical protein Blue_222 [Bacillus phage Deep Blue]